MGIGITQEQRELADAVRGWVARVVPPEEVRKLLDTPPQTGARPAYWDALAASGLLAPHLEGGTLLDLAVVVEEAARAALPGAYLPSALASVLLDRAGARPLGGRVGAVALGPGSMSAVAVEGGGHLLDGAAPPVLGAGEADLVLLAAEAAHGTRWFAVDAAALDIRTHEGADPTRPTAEVRARGVVVAPGRLLELDAALVRDLACALFAADACGTAAWALHTAAEYAKVREQFGRPIGRFQGVKHLCADMLVRLEQARALAWDAANSMDEAPDVRSLVAALAAGTALDAAYSCAKDCIQILGGIGFTWEHDAHVYLRRALVARQLLGSGDGHRLRAVRLAAAGARRELRLELPARAEAYRAKARAAIEDARGLDPAAARRVLAPTGYAAPYLPPPYGLGAGPVEQLVVQQELRAAGVKVADLGIATWVVPSLLAYGTPAQREAYVLPTLRGELTWCQLFSEPGAGSDLASLRTRAERTAEGGWRINGQKVWTSSAHTADLGILLARTDPAAPKHKGLGYFVVDMKRTPGIDIRPLKEITGEALFNEVYFDDVLLPADALVGAADSGWQVARNTLGNERVHMADQMTFDTGLEALIARSADLDGAGRARIGALAAEAHALACIGLRTTLSQVSGLEPGAGASVRKLVQTPHQQRTAELALELLGPAGAVREGAGERAVHGLLMSRCLTIAGGTTQVQLNVVAERILGLPRD
ncbi:MULTISPECIES: acyl-CoA dehydrogenase [unclassified Streptomyces]|uniref:acyl-CoA dehydrogenase n=1 Tax=unclassified Streptomyces TaxID=2593676 RepID=UPI0022598F0C|nr:MULTISPECIES: acyl-CoA dehydrogenase family protein [unclassified Streptomyces]MCX4525642.1 acyl-CoA dehydrogenase family protein [Streptomyces sp. NBC_01551]MCX4543886.1 acyl-CoA dehydrogenase family protein [Streptomyces sp. NBC_01565]